MIHGESERGQGAGPATLRQALRDGAAFLAQSGVESARLDCELLLGKVLGRRREGIYAHDEAPLAAAERELFNLALRRRARREPLAYITGEREFWSLAFFVTPEVLVPRPETEVVVETALRLLARSTGSQSPSRLLDLGTGSGAIAVSLAKERAGAEIWATDFSPKALEIARANAAGHGVGARVHFLLGDLFEPLSDKRDFFDLIVSNPPYIRRGEIENLPPEIRDWEPRSALDGGVDGLDFYRRIVGEGHLYLRERGLVILEIGADMADGVCRLFRGLDCYGDISVRQDYAGRERVVCARKR